MNDLSRKRFTGLLRSTFGIAAGLSLAFSLAYGNIPGDGYGDSGVRRSGKWADGGLRGLSKDQRQKMQAAFKAEEPAIKPLRRALRDAVIKLKDRLEDTASSNDLLSSIDDVTKARQALQAERRQFRAKINTILTPAQRAHALLFRMHRHHGMRRGSAWRRGPAGCGMMRRHEWTSGLPGPAGGASADQSSAPGSSDSPAGGQ